jgi:hypothetical protein
MNIPGLVALYTAGNLLLKTEKTFLLHRRIAMFVRSRTQS